jgi:hypothetical protein
METAMLRTSEASVLVLLDLGLPGARKSGAVSNDRPREPQALQDFDLEGAKLAVGLVLALLEHPDS